MNLKGILPQIRYLISHARNFPLVWSRKTNLPSWSISLFVLSAGPGFFENLRVQCKTLGDAIESEFLAVIWCSGFGFKPSLLGATDCKLGKIYCDETRVFRSPYNFSAIFKMACFGWGFSFWWKKEGYFKREEPLFRGNRWYNFLVRNWYWCSFRWSQRNREFGSGQLFCLLRITWVILRLAFRSRFWSETCWNGKSLIKSSDCLQRISSALL